MYEFDEKMWIAGPCLQLFLYTLSREIPTNQHLANSPGDFDASGPYTILVIKVSFMRGQLVAGYAINVEHPPAHAPVLAFSFKFVLSDLILISHWRFSSSLMCLLGWNNQKNLSNKYIFL